MNDAGAAGRPVDAYVPVNLRPDGEVAPRRDVSALLAKLTGDAPVPETTAVEVPAPRAVQPPATPGLAEDLVRPAVPLLAPDPQQEPVDVEALVTSGGDDSGPAFKVNDVLVAGLEAGASDIHLTSGAEPTVRLSGELTPLEGFDKLTPRVLQQAIYAILTQKQREQFEANLELDFAYQVPGHSRFRVNVYRQRESLGAAFRRIPYEIKPLEDLGVPPVVGSFAGLQRGFVLVTGPTGSGKSTTLASIVDLANRTRKDHIMTVEDPIEFLHRHKSCLVNQREVGEDTKSFANALKHVLRQDPDIILVGEMRDLETISVALTAAETGHLVFGTLHTQDAAQTIDRVIDVFPPHQQQQIRVQLAGALQGVVCQTLCKRADGRGRVVATEVLVATPAIRNLIREGKTHQIGSAMQAGAQFGMHTLDQHLAELVRTRQITFEHGLEKCHAADEFRRLTGRI
ncbi:type IV pilus twitching motility protein PilT [Kineococcus sp. TRM81007]|uniref:type IV pilus twitching motility protein PilT n=1 Tax=Kineococcus sp. TRM81007 TaxID=2925831 RepID=UPI001F5AEC9B|nr:type IV pilus twitching motility protein PilT [Kineococcus sp. TRM81007]MCI2239004.1 type IV pilus twitching motility protein PilT [Kineococcus sp. TRM81007]